MTTLKEDVMKAVAGLPSSAEAEDIMYRTYVIDKIRKGQEAIANNQVTTLEELKREMCKW